MSINVVVGADAEDITKLEDTIDLLYILKQLMSNQNSILDAYGKSFDTKTLDDIIDWYKSMHSILTNPSFALSM